VVRFLSAKTVDTIHCGVTTAIASIQSLLDQLNAEAAKLICTNLLPDQIRMVMLFRGEKDTPLDCELDVSTLPITRSVAVADMPKYEALSYVWGTQENTSTLTFNGQIYYITRNLESALRGIRFPDQLVAAAHVGGRSGRSIVYKPIEYGREITEKQDYVGGDFIDL
jgi:hypothetical protein